MDKKRSWVEIPSLEGLKVDWEHQPESAMDRRASVRMSMKALAKLFATKEMHVQVFVPGQMHTARLRDLSEGGLSLELLVRQAPGARIQVGVFLGQRKVIASVEVCHVREVDNVFVTGVRFLGLNKETTLFIRELYAALVLSRAL